jgi:outer membrane protein
MGGRAAGAWIAAAAAITAAQASEPASSPPSPDRTTLPTSSPKAAAAHVGPPLWEVGVFGFGLSQLAYPGADQQVGRGLVVPYAIYRGTFLRVDRETTGLRALKTPTIEIDVGVAGSFGSSASDIEARRGMRNLGTLVEAGPRLKWNIGRWAGGRLRAEFPLRGVFDLSDSLARRGLAFEPELAWERRADRWTWAGSIGGLFADRSLANTFYGVAPSEVTAERAAWDGRAGRIAWRLSGSVGHDMGADWRVFGFVRVDSVAGAANAASPLVRRSTGTSVGVGVSWTGFRSSRPAVD